VTEATENVLTQPYTSWFHVTKNNTSTIFNFFNNITLLLYHFGTLQYLALSLFRTYSCVPAISLLFSVGNAKYELGGGLQEHDFGTLFLKRQSGAKYGRNHTETSICKYIYMCVCMCIYIFFSGKLGEKCIRCQKISSFALRLINEYHIVQQ